jgi:hypothetical protein
MHLQQRSWTLKSTVSAPIRFLQHHNVLFLTLHIFLVCSQNEAYSNLLSFFTECIPKSRTASRQERQQIRSPLLLMGQTPCSSTALEDDHPGDQTDRSSYDL